MPVTVEREPSSRDPVCTSADDRPEVMATIRDVALQRGKAKRDIRPLPTRVRCPQLLDRRPVGDQRDLDVGNREREPFDRHVVRRRTERLSGDRRRAGRWPHGGSSPAAIRSHAKALVKAYCIRMHEYVCIRAAVGVRSGLFAGQRDRRTDLRWPPEDSNPFTGGVMKRRIRQHRVTGTRIAVVMLLAGAIAAASVLAVTAGAATSAKTGSSCTPLLAASVHPPGFDNTKEIGLRNALVAALKGKSVSSVKSWMVVNILAAYWVAGKQGDARAAKELGIGAHFEGPSQGQLAKQVSMFNTLAATGATGYFASVIDPVSEGSIINKAVAKGIDVVAIDSPVPANDAKTFTFIGTPNVTAGFAAGQAMLKALPNGGDVAILVGSLTATNVIQRTQGFMQAIKGSKLKVISTENDNGVAATAATNASTVIASHPDLKGIYAEYSYEGPAAAVAVKNKGDIGKISVVADDNEPGTITGLKNGAIVASILQQPFMQGYLGAYVTAAMHVLGPAKVASIMKPFETAGVISTGVGTLTKANLSADIAYNKAIGVG